MAKYYIHTYIGIFIYLSQSCLTYVNQPDIQKCKLIMVIFSIGKSKSSRKITIDKRQFVLFENYVPHRINTIKAFVYVYIAENLRHFLSNALRHSNLENIDHKSFGATKALRYRYTRQWSPSRSSQLSSPLSSTQSKKLYL